jgi:phage shock protein A
LVRFEQFERRMDDIEGHVESYDLGGKKDLAEEIAELESEDAIESELRELKSKRAASVSDSKSQ